MSNTTDRTVVPLRPEGDELRALRVENAERRTAMQARIVIEQAKGAICARLDTTPEVAFELLRGLARSQRRKLADYAAEVVANRGRLDGAIPAVRPRAGDARPRLLFVTTPTSGQCRKAEGWIAQILQHRRNHRRIKLITVDVDSRPELKERFRVEQLPTLVLVEDQKAKARLESPRGTKDIAAMLAPWLL
jgi:hypothetical protein